jgi:hypothetical protein
MAPRVSETEALAFRLAGFNVKVAFTLVASGWTDDATALQHCEARRAPLSTGRKNALQSEDRSIL